MFISVSWCTLTCPLNGHFGALVGQLRLSQPTNKPVKENRVHHVDMLVTSLPIPVIVLDVKGASHVTKG